MARYDLILTGGRLLDPDRGLDGPADIAFQDGRIAEIAPSIAPHRADEVQDMSGHLVVPGIIDLHTHVYWQGSSISVDPAAYCRTSAVTTAVDAGSAGPGNFAGFRRHVIEPSPVRILAYLHISHAGIFAFSKRIMVGESEEMRLMDPETAVEVARGNRDVICGIKVRLGRWTSGANGIAPLDYAMQVAEAADLPLMVHIDDPPPSYDEVADRLRPGDVLTHCFRPFPNTPLTGDGKVRPAVLAARERGVLFDIGHGMGSFSFDVAEAMLGEGFPPDVISSDIHVLCIDGPAFDQLTTMSKFLCLGMSLEDVIRASTSAPARAVGRADLGVLAEGATGDVSVLTLEEGVFDYVDATGKSLTGNQKLAARGVVVGGVWWPPI